MALFSHLIEQLLVPSPSIATVPVAEATSQVLARATQQLEALFQVLSCASPPSVTAGATSLEVVLDRCTSDLFALTLDGRVRVDVGFETAACGVDQCPTAVLWHATSPPDDPLLLEAPGVSIAIVSPVDITVPVDPAGTRELETPRADNTVDGTSTRIAGSWTADSCITIDLDGTITPQPDGVDPDLEMFYPIAFTVRALRDCLAACPSSGDVLLSYANGVVLTWTYEGTDSVIVHGLDGYEEVSPIPCN
jgi:hypothetical protein